jgi:predicted PhzF superfamily epimerase YddE/YHI9
MEALLYFFKVFTEQAQSGNPAASALFNEWPDTYTLQHIALEADQVVTAFVVPAADSPYQYHIR